MNDLSQRLEDGVPTPPDLSDIAARSAAAGRRRRTRNRLAAGATVALVVAGGLALPRVVADRPPDPAQRSEAACVAAPDAPASEITTQDATWVRFCELAEEGVTGRARYPRGAITGGLANSIVRGWGGWALDRRSCDESQPTRRQFRIEVGLADGRVTQLTGNTGCSAGDRQLFTQLEGLLVDQAQSRLAGARVEPEPITCPGGLAGTVRTSTDGASAELLRDPAQHPSLSSVPLLPMPATTVDVCAYTGDGVRRDLVDQWRVGTPVSETIRVEATLGYMDGMADCELQPGATSYLVVMHDLSGTARSFAIDTTACNEMSAATGFPATDNYLGLASQQLIDVVAGSKP